jgi:hypothetical protein
MPNNIEEDDDSCCDYPEDIADDLTKSELEELQNDIIRAIENFGKLANGK